MEMGDTPNKNWGVVIDDIAVSSNSPGNAEWTFDAMAGPSAADYADLSQKNGVTIKAVAGTVAGADVSCLIDGAPQKSANDADPCFVDMAGGDYHLRWDSPCIDAGEPGYIP